jgi:hypothetical protein
MALAVLASVFAVEEPPKVQASTAPTTIQASFTPETHNFSLECDKPVSIVVVRVGHDKVKSDPFLEWIRSTQSGSKPVAAVPWYVRTEEFALPTLGETTGVLEALFAPEGDL